MWLSAGKEVDSIPSVPLSEVVERLEDKDSVLLDVRKPNEYRIEHIEGAENIPLDYVNENMASIDRDKTYLVHCASGYRSMIFISILRARGFDNLVDIAGGFKDIKNSGRFRIMDISATTHS